MSQSLGSSRPFRFGVNLLAPAPLDEWRAKCRRAEELGYDVILVPDHLGMPAPFPSLVAAAEVTERPRLGTFVLNAGFWNPTLLAREVATTDTLTGGRLELGLGTGYIPADRPGTVQRPRVPLLIGANGDRMLRLTAEHADIAAFTGARTSPGGTLEPITAAEMDERVAVYREAAEGRKEPAELNLLIQILAVTDDRGAAIRPWLPRIPNLTEDEVLELPIVLVGTLEQIVAQVRAQRERYGFSYLTVLEPNMEAFAPVVEALRGE
jgi:alkanesulfonate monooxygenase SsuD/methylene tetrahydromethanopterin reductase-like flavin-dependent oxidoreductase (luciferase family)